MKFKGYFEGYDEIMRRIIVNLHGLPPEVREMDVFERCYSCRLFDDRTQQWDIEWDSFGNYIPQKLRKPNFEDPIGRKIVDTVVSSVFGYEQFPDISVKTTRDIYKDDLIKYEIDRGDLDADDVDGLTPEERKRLEIDLCSKHLQKLTKSILNQSFLNLPMIESTRLALIMGRAIVVFKAIDGVFYMETINYKWVRNLKFDDRIPKKINSFSEMYQYEDVDDMDPTKIATYWYRRDFNEDSEILYLPAKQIGNAVPVWRIDKRIDHNFGFCPAVLVETPTGRSILDGQIENIRSYIYYTNAIFTGSRQNMNPQWIVTTKPDESGIHDQQEPKRRGSIWEFPNATNVQAIAPDAGGYEAAQKFRESLRQDILEGCQIVEADSKYMSGTALRQTMAPTENAIGEYRIAFGEQALVKLCEMVLRACVIFKQRGEDILLRNGAMIPDEFDCIVSLGWGQIHPVTEDDIMKKVTNALTAKNGGLIDKEHAVKYVASYFDVIEVEDMINKLEEQEEVGFDSPNSQELFGALNNKIKGKLVELTQQEKQSKDIAEASNNDSA